MTFSEHPVMSWTSWWSLLSSCILNTAIQGACSLPTPCFLTKVRIRKLKEAPLSECPLSSVKSHVVQMGMRRGCRKPDLTSDCQRSFPTQSLLQLHRPAVNVTSLPTAPTGPTPLPSFWLMLVMNFLPPVLPFTSVSKSQVSQYFFAFHYFIGRFLYQVVGHFFKLVRCSKKWDLQMAPNMCRHSAVAVHGKMLPKGLVFPGKLTLLDRDLVLSPLAKPLGFKSFLSRPGLWPFLSHALPWLAHSSLSIAGYFCCLTHHSFYFSDM